MSNKSNARYTSRELRDKENQTQIQRYISSFEPVPYVPAFTKKDFKYPLRIFHKGTSSEKLQQYKLGVHNSNSHSSTQEGGIKLSTKQRKVYSLLI